MRIAILTQYYPPETGAPQKRLSELAKAFVRRGHEVHVLTAMPNYPAGRIHEGYGGLIRRDQLDGIEILRTFIYPTQSAGKVRRLTNYFSFVLSSAIFGSLCLKRADFLIVESPPLFLGLSGYWLSRLKCTRLIFNVSDLWPESAVRLGMLSTDGLAYKLSAWLESFCYQKAWLITGQSKSILSDIEARFPNVNTYHLSNGVDTQLFGREKSTEQARAMIAPNGQCVALYAGLHGLAQGLDQIVEAAHLLRDRENIGFVLIGDGPEKKALITQANCRNLENIRFLDPLPPYEIPALSAAADIVLVPLKMYIPGAVPSKLYEAMASEKPVILVAEDEAADIVRKHNAGIVVKPGDVAGIVAAMKTLSGQPELREEMGKNGRQAAKRHFDRTSIASRFIEYLETHHE